MADLVALPYMSEVFCATSNGNIAKTVAMNVIWFSLGMIIVSQFCPAMTQIAIEQGVNLADYNAKQVYQLFHSVYCVIHLLLVYLRLSGSRTILQLQLSLLFT
ncbi:MAG: hypothetical protein ACLUR5_06030 [Eubacterium ventriosum]